MKLKKLFILTLSVFALGTLCGCAGRHIIMAEVLQVPDHTSIYTAYNIWYTDPMNVDSQNILKGEILPFGTEVEIINLTDKQFHFRTVRDSKEFRIKYNSQAHLKPTEEFIRELFTIKHPDELVEGIRPIVYEKLKRGTVEKGMTKEEVILGYGHPAASRTPSEKEDTWVYWTDPVVGKRIVFLNGKVTEIIVL